MTGNESYSIGRCCSREELEAQRQFEAECLEYEGLVYSTTARFQGFLAMEPEDLQQILRIRVVKALRTYDPTRKAAKRNWVFSLVYNQVKDLIKQRDRSLKRYVWEAIDGGSAVRVVAQSGGATDDLSIDHEQTQPAWETFQEGHLSATQEEAFALVEDKVMLPSTITPLEREVLAFVYLDFQQVEIQALMGMGKREVKGVIDSIREKMADWKPDLVAEVLALPQRSDELQSAAA